ncbi:type II toxin-antitoxin system Phd/YefM family antitoxin [Deinococcus alpinitundrae]|uniref:type II toxin-antitoxin system Phd/YefM family antitoxin n=1 Tax=Deinococcus alpinitundrae TaxID=468913 RepID=UPI00137B5468|nr:hypothetical protein [Deinococcus alpinitundrae]
MPQLQRIDLHHLRRSWYDVLTGVTHGQSYLITRRGTPFAQLQPLEHHEQPPQITVPYDDAISTTVHRLAHELTPATLTTLLGITDVLLDAAIQTGYLPTDVLSRLDALDDLITLLGRQHSLTPHPWLHLPRRELQHRTPLQLLQVSWAPDSAGFLAIKRLALRDGMSAGS